MNLDIYNKLTVGYRVNSTQLWFFFKQDGRSEWIQDRAAEISIDEIGIVKIKIGAAGTRKGVRGNAFTNHTAVDRKGVSSFMKHVTQKEQAPFREEFGSNKLNGLPHSIEDIGDDEFLLQISTKEFKPKEAAPDVRALTDITEIGRAIDKLGEMVQGANNMAFSNVSSKVETLAHFHHTISMTLVPLETNAMSDTLEDTREAARLFADLLVDIVGFSKRHNLDLGASASEALRG